MQFVRLANRLYIGSIDEVAEHSTSNFDSVVSVCQDTVEDNVSCDYYQIPLADGRESRRNWGGTIEYTDFVRAAERVIEQLQYGDTLVHCHMGKNRSAAVCVAVLASAYDYSFGSAMLHTCLNNPRTDIVPLMYVFARRFARQW